MTIFYLMDQTAPDRVAELAANVRAEVARKGIKQHAIGEHLSLDQRAVSRRIRGQVEWSALELRALAELLDIPTADLLAEATAAASP